MIKEIITKVYAKGLKFGCRWSDVKFNDVITIKSAHIDKSYIIAMYYKDIESARYTASTLDEQYFEGAQEFIDNQIEYLKDLYYRTEYYSGLLAKRISTSVDYDFYFDWYVGRNDNNHNYDTYSLTKAGNSWTIYKEDVLVGEFTYEMTGRKVEDIYNIVAQVKNILG